MEPAEDPNMYGNPCYSVSGTHSRVATKEAKRNIEEEANYCELEDMFDKPSEEAQAKGAVNTETIKPAKERDRILLIVSVVLCIAVASIAISVVALVLSLWSAFTPSTTSQGTARVLQQNQTFVTLDQQNQTFVTHDQLNQAFVILTQELNDTLLTLGYSIENVNNSLVELTTVVKFDVNSTLSSHESDINNLSGAIQKFNNDVAMESERVNHSLSSHAASIQTVSDNLQTLTDFLSLRSISACGSGNWRRVAYVNMAISSQQCPSAWREYTSPVRSCGRPSTSSGSCPSTIFGTYGVTYNRVCGRATGYQFGTPDAYAVNDVPNPRQVMSVDDNYVDGVSVSRGNSRTHIWTFAAGNSVRSSDLFACRCDNPSARRSPSFVGNNYFCESSATSDLRRFGTFYTNNRLWDGSGCAGGTCCTFNSPPWFNVQLPSSTIDDIEVRICGDEGTDNEDTPIGLLEIYVQ